MTIRRTRTPPTLIATAISLGYGPAAKLLVLTSGLRQRGVRVVFVGNGSALELASRHGKLFGDVIAAAGPSDVSGSLWRSAAGHLSVMDRTFAPQAVARGVPLFVVDSLLWMRDGLPAAWQAAERLWAQNFLGLHDWPGLGSSQIRVVGPIVAPDLRPPSGRSDGLLINLGGCGGSYNIDYARFVTRIVLASPLAAQFAGRVTILSGEQCIRALQAEQGATIQLCSASHTAALARLDQAELVLTAPGLTATLESFQRCKPTFFLPPQNYSQWCILRALRGAGLAPAALHWEDLPEVAPLAERLPEEVRNPLVRQALALGTADAAAAAAMQECCARISEMDWAELAAWQHAFYASLGDNGAKQIAADLAGRLSRARSEPAAAAPI